MHFFNSSGAKRSLAFPKRRFHRVISGVTPFVPEEFVISIHSTLRSQQDGGRNIRISHYFGVYEVDLYFNIKL